MTASDLAGVQRPAAAASGAAMLELSGLSKRYGSVVALARVSFAVEAGRICGFVGANGAGKTTAMRIAMGVTSPDEGEVRWNGGPVTAADRRGFGYMPEERGLYPKMRVGQQLTYLARLHGHHRAAAEAAARHWIERLGLGDRVGDRLERLSLGNQQRVQLAAALVHEPGLLILDEPFAGLDPGGVDALSEVLRERAEAGVAVLFSSHQLELVERLCAEVVIISEGHLVAAGPVEELRAGEQRLLRVHVPGADGVRWAHGLGGVGVVRQDERGTLLSLAREADSESVLDAARRAGRVQHFGFEQRSLAEIFREVVEQ